MFNNFLLLSTGNVPSSFNSILSNNGQYISINTHNTGEKVIKLNDQVANGYVLIRDSWCSVDLNITGNVLMQGKMFNMGNFKIRTDGIYNDATYNLLSTTGTSSDREFFITTQKLYLARGSTNGVVYVGYDISDDVDLNISGNLYVQGSTAKVNNKNICLEDGTNCPTGSTKNGNITGSGTENYLAKWTSDSNIESSLLYESGGKLVSSTSIELDTDDDQVSKFGTDTLIINSSSDKIGVGNTNPLAKLDISGNPRWDDSTSNPTFVIRSSEAGETTKHLRAGYDSIGANDFAFIQAGETGVGAKPIMLQGQGGNIGVGAVTSPLARLHINTDDTGAKGLIVKGASGQTANLQEWWDGSGSTIARITPKGYFRPGDCNGGYSEGEICYDNNANQMCYYDGSTLKCW